MGLRAGGEWRAVRRGQGERGGWGGGDGRGGRKGIGGEDEDGGRGAERTRWVRESGRER